MLKRKTFTMLLLHSSSSGARDVSDDAPIIGLDISDLQPLVVEAEQRPHVHHAGTHTSLHHAGTHHSLARSRRIDVSQDLIVWPHDPRALKWGRSYTQHALES